MSVAMNTTGDLDALYLFDSDAAEAQMQHDRDRDRVWWRRLLAR